MLILIISCYFVPQVLEPLTLESPEFQRILEEPEPLDEPEPEPEDSKPMFDLLPLIGDENE
jgi:hypothetical protein